MIVVRSGCSCLWFELVSLELFVAGCIGIRSMFDCGLVVVEVLDLEGVLARWSRYP